MNELTYYAAGEYLLPNLKLSDLPDAPPLGKYGMLHKRSTCGKKKPRCTPPCCSQSAYILSAGLVGPSGGAQVRHNRKQRNRSRDNPHGTGLHLTRIALRNEGNLHGSKMNLLEP